MESAAQDNSSNNAYNNSHSYNTRDSSTEFEGIPTDTLLGAIATITGISSLIIFGSAGARSSQLRSLTGGQVAESLGGRLVASNTTNPQERRLLNIVEEMSIASGISMPQVYILDNEDSINAFAAGWSSDAAAVAVTRGALTYFNRDELQGVIGHEFSHILNGDMTIDMRLVGMVFGLEAIFIAGYVVFRISTEFTRSSSSDSDSSKGALIALAIMLISLAVMIIGYIGKIAADVIRMAISRQKEYLADASAVQFTRNPEGIGYALIKIQNINAQKSISNPAASACGHFFFSNIDKSGWMDSHPPLSSRIHRILPQYNDVIPESVKRDLKNPPGTRFQDEPQPKESARERFKKRLPRQLQDNFDFLNKGLVTTGAAASEPEVSGADASSSSSAPDSSVPSDNSTNFPQINLDEFDNLVHDPYSSHGVIYAMLMDSNPEVQEAQWNILRANQNEHLLNLVKSLIPKVASLSCAEKIYLAEVSFSALRHMSSPQYQTFRSNIIALTEVDKKIDLFEFGVRMILTGRLDIDYGLRKEPIHYNSLVDYTNEFCAALGYLAWQGADNDNDAHNAFSASAKLANVNKTIPDKPSCTLNAFIKSLMKIQTASKSVKRLYFNAFVACINYDNKITPREEDLIYIIEACLNQRCEPQLANNSQ